MVICLLGQSVWLHTRGDIKKVAEAKARKKLKAQRIWNKIKRQATSIADNNDLSEKTKIKQIEKLYGKLGRKKNKRVEEDRKSER